MNGKNGRKREERRLRLAVSPPALFADDIEREEHVDLVLALLRDERTLSPRGLLGRPSFTVPARAARQIGWPVCPRCDRGVDPRHDVSVEGSVRWGGETWHPSCVHDELFQAVSDAA